MNLLIIVDPQYDFIEGGKLPVEGGTKALDNVANLIKKGDIGQVIITKDWHPADHISFDHFGGDFPEHCVQDSFGAKVYQPIIDAIKEANVEVLDTITKGMDREEFSAIEPFPVKRRNSFIFDLTDGSTLSLGDDNVILCGLAGDICVLNTLDALNYKDAPYNLFVYLEGTASLDDGSKLDEYMVKNDIKVFRNYPPEE